MIPLKYKIDKEEEEEENKYDIEIILPKFCNVGCLSSQALIIFSFTESV